MVVGGEDLTQGQKDELWPPWVLAIVGMGEDWSRWGGGGGSGKGALYIKRGGGESEGSKERWEI